MGRVTSHENESNNPVTSSVVLQAVLRP